MKDFLGNPLSVGDMVVLTAPKYRHFTKAKILKFTTQKVLVEFNNTWNFGKNGHIQTYLSEPNFLILIGD